MASYRARVRFSVGLEIRLGICLSLNAPSGDIAACSCVAMTPMKGLFGCEARG